MSHIIDIIAVTLAVIGIVYLTLHHGRQEILRRPVKYTPESRASKARGDEAEWLDTFPG